MKTRIRVLLLLALAAGAAWWATQHFSQRTAENGSVVRVSGNIEVTDAEVSFKIPGRVEAREVTEGEMVQAGQTVARLEKGDLAQEVALRRAEVSVAQAVLAELEAGTRPEEIAQGEAALVLAQAEAERARLDFTRQKDLRAQSVNTARDFELADTALKTAQARVREAQERLTLLKNGPRKEHLEQARARVEQAKQALGLAETRLGYATLVSPLTGLVLSKNIEPGEYVAPGTPVITVGDLAHPWLRAYINETDLGRVKVGQAVTVTTDTYPDKKYEGTVTFISAQAEFTPKNVQTKKERVKLVYRIKVELPNPHQELKPGMPADAEIRLAPEPPSNGRHTN
jgi:HlyD family secretion protein